MKSTIVVESPNQNNIGRTFLCAFWAWNIGLFGIALWSLAGFGYALALSLLGWRLTGAGHGTGIFGLVGYGLRGVGFCMWPSVWFFAALAKFRGCRIAAWLLMAGSLLWIFYLFLEPSFERVVFLRAIKDGVAETTSWLVIFLFGQLVILSRLIAGSKRPT